MQLLENTVYINRPVKLADPLPNQFPNLNVRGGTISVYTGDSIPLNYSDITDLDLDTEELPVGNWAIFSEFKYIGWKTKTGTPRVTLSRSISLEKITT